MGLHDWQGCCCSKPPKNMQNRLGRQVLPSHTQLVIRWTALIPLLPHLFTHTLASCCILCLQTADKEAGANCKNVSLHRGKASIKQRFQTGSVDEVCFLGALSMSSMADAVFAVVCDVLEWFCIPVIICHPNIRSDWKYVFCTLIHAGISLYMHQLTDHRNLIGC